MKNSLNLALTVLFLAVLGCSCPKINDLIKKSENAPPPTPAATPFSPQSQSTPARSSTPATGDLTLDKYNQIKTNMPRSDVETLLGGKGTQVSSSTGGGVTFEVHKWATPDYKTIIITFRNDKVMTKTQVGLE
ncbi:MAG TPA: hypothetical protein VL325_04815 [Pyrinomonadaceae bacterium]|nr:hypothetical protein [Pyrinomonadaceae bacterium]